MSESLTDQQWQEYLVKEDRDILWRSLLNLRAAQAGFTITNSKKLHDATALIAEEVETELKKQYKEISMNENNPAKCDHSDHNKGDHCTICSPGFVMSQPDPDLAKCGCLDHSSCKDGVCDCRIDPVLSLMHKMAVGEGYTVLSEALRAARKEGMLEVSKELLVRADFLDKTKRSIIDADYLREIADAIRKKVE